MREFLRRAARKVFRRSQDAERKYENEVHHDEERREVEWRGQ